MKKATIAILLILALCIAAFPYGVFAAEDDMVIKEVDKYIYGVHERTTLSKFNGAYHRTGFIMMNTNGGVVSGNNEFIGTGYTLRFESDIGQYTTLTLIVLGDIDGNGRVTSGDYLNIRAYLKGSASLSEIQLAAADVNGDGNVSTFDYMLVKSHFLGEYDIYKNQKMPDTSEDTGSSAPVSEPWTSGWA